MWTMFEVAGGDGEGEGQRVGKRVSRRVVATVAESLGAGGRSTKVNSVS